MSIPNTDITVEAGDWPSEAKLAEITEKAVRAVSVEAGLIWPQDAELSLLFTNDTAMAKINGQWRGKEKTTNVLSFPGGDIEIGQPSDFFIGDLIFAFETVMREAKTQEKSFEDHLVHLIIHGFLHLFGYDHIESDEAEVMEAIEIACLAKLGINDPYANI